MRELHKTSEKVGQCKGQTLIGAFSEKGASGIDQLAYSRELECMGKRVQRTTRLFIALSACEEPDLLTRSLTFKDRKEETRNPRSEVRVYLQGI